MIICFVIATVLVIAFLVSLIPIYAKEYVKKEYEIRFNYPDEWELTTKNEMVSFSDEYNEILLAIFSADPDPNISNFVSLTIYTNMTNSNEFLNIIRNELNTDEKGDTEILDTKKYKNVRGDSTLLIKTLYTPKLTVSPGNFESKSDERTFIVFHEDEIGYKIIYSMPLGIAYKYQDDVFSIVQQIRNNKG